MEYWHQITFFDSANPQGWVSQFGHLNGGTNFFTSLIGDGGPTANVSWDFSSLPGYSMRILLVEGSDGPTDWANLYAVGTRFLITNPGDMVTLHDGVNINSIAFYGRTPTSPVPDTGSTLMLLGIALLALPLWKLRRHCGANCAAKVSSGGYLQWRRGPSSGERGRMRITLAFFF
jgi:hypothetical protein